MSYRRIILGVLIGASLLAGGLVAAWHFGWPMQVVPGVFFLIVAIYGLILCEIHRAKALRPYLQRGCMGIRWRRRFPDSPKSEIHEFLRLFIRAFGIRQHMRGRISPDDRVMSIYRAINPPEAGLADAMELETFTRDMRARYKLNLEVIWREDMTLGEVYSLTQAVRN